MFALLNNIHTMAYQTKQALESQIEIISAKLSTEPKFVMINGKSEYNRKHFALKGMKSNLEKKLSQIKHNDWLAQ